MPIPFECPNCNRRGQAQDELAGRIVKCPACGGSLPIAASSDDAEAARFPLVESSPFDGPSVNPVPPPPPPPAEEELFDPEAVPLLPASPRRAPARTGGFFSGVDALFDLNLRRYVTPILLRFYWWMTLCVASLMLLLFVFTQFTDGSFIGEVTGAPAWSEFSPDASRGGSKDSKFVEAVGTILGTITKWAVRLYFIAMVVFSIRVALELMMVVFNIANSLSRVEQSVAVLSDSRE